MSKVQFLSLLALLLVACAAPAEKTNEAETTEATEEVVVTATQNIWEQEYTLVATADPGEVSQTSATQTFTIDPAASIISWRGKKATYGHHGTIGVQSGSIAFGETGLSALNLSADMSTIADQDIEDPEKNGQLVGHLSSSDFFDVASYPTASFELVNAKALEGDNYELTGNLTIKGTSKLITFPALVKQEGGNVKANAAFGIDRTAWGVNYNSGSVFVDMVADKIISDQIDFNIELIGSGSQQTASAN